MTIKHKINKIIKSALLTLNLPEVAFNLEHPSDEAHGDYATNVALVLFAQSKKQEINGMINSIKNPRELAQSIADKIVEIAQDEKLISKIEVAGPGFINFYLDTAFFFNQIQIINNEAERYGSNESNQGKKAIVEYSSPNIAKPFTIGHLRSTIIGAAIANVLEANGWTVLRDNHLGDWGTQFGKQIYALINLGEGSLNKNIEKINLSDNPVKALVSLYIEFHKKAEQDPSLEDAAREWFTKLEQGDKQARELWQQCIDWSWVEFNKIYQRLGIADFFHEFENGRGLGEAFFEDKMDVVINQLNSQGLLKEGKEGAKLVFFEHDKFPPAMILKKDGSTLYHTRDLATDYYRKTEYNPDLIINEVGAEQSLYFQQLYEMEEQLGWFDHSKRVHVAHGLYRFSDKKMSTRKGNVIWLEDVINEAQKRAEALQKDSVDLNVSHNVAIGALKWNDLKRSPIHNVTFDWDEILNMQGNSGPYLQYTYARGKSVLAKAGKTPDSAKVSQLNNEEKALMRWLYRFPEVVILAGLEYAPHHICTFLYELAQRFNTFYNQHSILGTDQHAVDEETKQLRLALTAATTQVLHNGLALLGIQTVEKM